MVTAAGPKVLGYNASFGDPEIQSMIRLLDERTDLAEVLMSCITKTLHRVHIGTIPSKVALNVVVAAQGYPEKFRTDDVIDIDIVPEGMPTRKAAPNCYRNH